MTNDTSYHATVGIDIAKNVFQVFKLTEDGEVSNKAVKRSDFLAQFQNCPRCLIGMEACGSSQYWARELQALGHDVRLMHPKAVKQFVKGFKNDRNDAEGIHRALINGVRAVTVKTPRIRDIDTLLTMRDKLIRDKTKTVNHVRGILSEYGIVMNKSVTAFMKNVGASVTELESQDDVCPAVVLQIRSSLEDIRKTIDRIQEIDKQLEALAKETKNYERFKTAPGVGPVTAAMLCVLLADPSLFRNGRQFAAYLGLAPMSFGSGGKNIVCSIPKRSGNIAVRALMVQCAHSIARNSYPSGWVESILKRKPKKVAVIAIANRLARQLWSMAKKGEDWKKQFVLAAVDK